MAGSYTVLVEGLAALRQFDNLGDRIELDMVKAVNRTAERGRTQAAREIVKQINFPASYVSPSAKRLFVSKKATRSDIEARIKARSRATSLARFVGGTAQPNKAGVSVEVQPGKARFLKKAFLVRLRAGNADIDTKSNLGLAVRLKPGESIRNKRKSARLAKGLYLLYGPSVDQIFRAEDGSGVAEDISPGLASFAAAEFSRLTDL